MRKTSKLPNADPPRIVFESSEMHRGAASAIQFKTIEEINNDKLGPVELYGRTKLAMILGAKIIRDKVIKPNGDNIFITSVHPGMVSDMLQHPGSASQTCALTLAPRRLTPTCKTSGWQLMPAYSGRS